MYFARLRFAHKETGMYRQLVVHTHSESLDDAAQVFDAWCRGFNVGSSTHKVGIEGVSMTSFGGESTRLKAAGRIQKQLKKDLERYDEIARQHAQIDAEHERGSKPH